MSSQSVALEGRVRRAIERLGVVLPLLFAISGGAFRCGEAGGSGDGCRAEAGVDGVGDSVELALLLVLRCGWVGEEALLDGPGIGEAADAHADEADAGGDRG